MRPSPPTPTPGAYRWYYADVHAPECTAVFIFMLGSPFSADYVRRAPQGALPEEHAAINVALYPRRGGRVWVLSEYGAAAWEPDGALAIGRSRLEASPAGGFRFTVRDRAGLRGRPLEASLILEPEVPAGERLTLVKGLPHHWQPLAARARATLQLPGLGLFSEGLGYFDSNDGDEPLGLRLGAWRWTRRHDARATRIHFAVLHQPSWEVTAAAGRVEHREGAIEGRAPGTLTRWGLRVPKTLDLGQGQLARPRVLESSPFYARLEAEGGGVHALSEVADFRRFRSPWIRWMAHFRTRRGEAA